MIIQKMKIVRRREAIQLIGVSAALLAFPKFSSSSVNPVATRVSEVTKGKAAEELDIYLEMPEIAENGNQVKILFEIDSPMTRNDHVTTVYIFADGNPEPDVAQFNFTPAMGACSATTRMRLSKTQNVVVLAAINDGSFAKAETKVKVTIGGCGG